MEVKFGQHGYRPVNFSVLHSESLGRVSGNKGRGKASLTFFHMRYELHRCSHGLLLNAVVEASSSVDDAINNNST